MKFKDLSVDQKIELLNIMITSRTFEEKVNEMFMKGAIHGTTHLGIGQEANHAAVSAALHPDDWILTTHRGHGHYIGKGGSPAMMMAELFGTQEGACLGLGGSMHLTDLEHHNMGSSGVVGGGVPISVGMAFALKYQKKNEIVLSMFGDGASNQGMVLESFNLASVWQVPVLFFCENNGYGMSASADRFVAGGNIPMRAEAFGIANHSVDGNNVVELYDAVSEAAEFVRTTKQPFLLESRTYRWLGHSKSDLRKYRTKEEEESWKSRCPICSYSEYLMEHDILNNKQIENMKLEVAERIDNIVKESLLQDPISLDEAIACVYRSEVTS